MLPASYQRSKYCFFLNDTAPYRVVFVTSAMVKQAASQPTDPLWYFEAGDERSFEALTRWIRVRRHLWSVWGQMAEQSGPAALACHLEKLMRENPPAESVAFFMERADGSDEISLGEVLAVDQGFHREVFYRHRFASEAASGAFKKWWLNNNPEVNGWAMLELALDRGTDALGQFMDEIAATPQAD